METNVSNDKPANRTIKFQLMLSQAESDQIDDWRFANRVNSKADAIRILVQKALSSEANNGGK